MILDVEAFGQDATQLGVNVARSESFKMLDDMVHASFSEGKIIVIFVSFSIHLLSRMGCTMRYLKSSGFNAATARRCSQASRSMVMWSFVRTRYIQG